MKPEKTAKPQKEIVSMTSLNKLREMQTTCAKCKLRRRDKWKWKLPTTL